MGTKDKQGWCWWVWQLLQKTWNCWNVAVKLVRFNNPAVWVCVQERSGRSFTLKILSSFYQLSNFYFTTSLWDFSCFKTTFFFLTLTSSSKLFKKIQVIFEAALRSGSHLQNDVIMHHSKIIDIIITLQEQETRFRSQTEQFHLKTTTKNVQVQL